MPQIDPDIPMQDIVDLPSIRGKLSGRNGKALWRSLDELSGSPEFERFLKAEFPEAATMDGVSRRQFLKLMGASVALAGATACTKQPTELIVPYVRQPEQLVPGKPLYYATAVPVNRLGVGALVEAHMGRPTKIEGNPEHPDSGGASDAVMQAAILDLYDPDRSRAVMNRGRQSTWDNFTATIRAYMQQREGGEGLRILTGAVTSPTVAQQVAALQEAFPALTLHHYDPVNNDAVYAGAERVFGEAVETLYHLERADVIVSLDSDFLYSESGHLAMTRAFSSRRGADAVKQGHMNRLYAAECSPTVTGATADHRLALKPSDMVRLAVSLARATGVAIQGEGLGHPHAHWVASVAADLAAHRGRCVVMAGRHQPAEVHAIAHAINAALDTAGKTVTYHDPVAMAPGGHMDSLQALCSAMRAGEVKGLLMLDVNPVYEAPADLGFASLLDSVEMRVHFGSHIDETARLSHWHLPASHFLEGWGDLRAYDGTVTIQQPLIRPLYQTRNIHEVLDILAGKGRPSYDILREAYEAQAGETFEADWKTAVHDGVVKGSAAKARAVQADAGRIGRVAPPKKAEGIELVLRPDPTIGAGRGANNGWLQELPRPLTTLTWDNAVLVSPAFAESKGFKVGDIVRLSVGERMIRVPLMPQPGIAEGTATLYLGYGRTSGGRIAPGVGVSAYALQSAAAPAAVSGAVIRGTDASMTLATTQNHHTMEGRELVRHATVDHYHAHPKFAQGHAHHGDADPSMYPDYKYEGYKWGMVIDLNRCTGCNACAIACQAENNIAVVGKDEVARGREMHWIRVDRYFEGEADDPAVHHQPVPCMHCERAPCEPVCPVGATVHSDEGLNDMVYNRCVGTRYCSNNCPYKVRRFNFFDYPDHETESLKLQRNPDVTVRMRGVMEKCTYCVQRISAARITAKNEGRRIRDGEVVTACQQACPAGAITFGDLNDEGSRVAKLAHADLNYALLGELNTKPRTTYLAKLKNPNPALGGTPTRAQGGHGHG